MYTYFTIFCKFFFKLSTYNNNTKIYKILRKKIYRNQQATFRRSINKTKIYRD